MSSSIKLVCAIRDDVAREFGPLQLVNNEDVARRMFHQSIPDSVRKEDFSLWCFGEFHVTDGEALLINNGISSIPVEV